MREILFRGFHSCENSKEQVYVNGKWINGFWVYGNLIQLHNGRRYIVNNKFGACIDDKGNFINTEYPFVCEVIPESVGQYTGLTDKNGTKIFEGDIIKTKQYGKNSGNGVNFNNFDTFEGVYDNCGYCLENSSRKFLLNDDLQKSYEVIGNINDNPELLEV